MSRIISQAEIRKKTDSWWPELLRATVEREPFFPKTITRVGRIRGEDILTGYAGVQEALTNLQELAKPNVPDGYVIHLKETHFQKAGSHHLPDYIEFETLEDYLAFTRRQDQWDVFTMHLRLIIQTIPELKGWILQNVLQLTDTGVIWTDILQVCLYFVQYPRPELYIRQLPIEVHTKFIEYNAPLLCSLLDYLIPGHIRNPDDRRIDRRYYLCYDEPLIRVRSLDGALDLMAPGNTGDGISYWLTDLSMPVSDFNRLILNVKNVVIAENKMNFLTLPALSDSVAIWSGGGFQVSCLREACWLSALNIYYWGDIDEHGFQILHQIRSYFPKTQSLMMDLETLEAFNERRGVGAKNRAAYLSLLTDEEQLCYQRIKEGPLNRLEQEKIDQQFVEDYLNRHVVGV